MTVKKSPSESSRLSTYTEDDTFRILARPDIHKMVILHREWIQKERDRKGVYDSRKNITFCKHNGWQWIEFLREKKSAGYFS